MSDQPLFQSYEGFLHKIDLFCADIVHRLGSRLQCRAGCALCCGRDIDVLPVEFHFLHSRPIVSGAVKQLGSVSLRGGNCSFLHQDRCAIYPHRPVICRTHGLPLLVRCPEGEQRDCCPLHAGPLGLGTLARSDLIDLETLNTLLSAVNLLFCKQAGLDPAQKLPLSCLFDRA